MQKKIHSKAYVSYYIDPQVATSHIACAQRLTTIHIGMKKWYLTGFGVVIHTWKTWLVLYYSKEPLIPVPVGNNNSLTSGAQFIYRLSPPSLMLVPGPVMALMPFDCLAYRQLNTDSSSVLSHCLDGSH
jgi:hypothetical protein